VSGRGQGADAGGGECSKKLEAFKSYMSENFWHSKGKCSSKCEAFKSRMSEISLDFCLLERKSALRSRGLTNAYRSWHFRGERCPLVNHKPFLNPIEQAQCAMVLLGLHGPAIVALYSAVCEGQSLVSGVHCVVLVVLAKPPRQ
jgi:hypothetical protein